MGAELIGPLRLSDESQAAVRELLEDYFSEMEPEKFGASHPFSSLRAVRDIQLRGVLAYMRWRESRSCWRVGVDDGAVERRRHELMSFAEAIVKWLESQAVLAEAPRVEVYEQVLEVLCGVELGVGTEVLRRAGWSAEVGIRLSVNCEVE